MHLIEHSFLNKENYFHICIILSFSRESFFKGKRENILSLRYSAFHTKDVKNECLSKTQGKGTKKKEKDPSMGKE